MYLRRHNYVSKLTIFKTGFFSHLYTFRTRYFCSTCFWKLSNHSYSAE